jgi:aminopeptidase N
MRRWSLVLFVFFIPLHGAGQGRQGRQGGQGAALRDPDPGISESLARERKAHVSDVRYDLSLTIPANPRTPVTGREILTFTLSDATIPLSLDFAPNQSGRLRRVDVDGASGAPIEARQVNGHILLPAEALRAGSNRITIDFDAGDAPLNRNTDFLYTIFVPARAHEAFPCFDQPDLKAKWNVALDVPDGWETLANGAETARASSKGRTRVAFVETQPISTYLMAFAAGKFFVERAERNGRTLRMLHRETDAAKIARNRDAVFDLHAAAIDWMEQYTGIPYPFGKFDMLLVPAFQFGGMEHPGAIFYSASGLLLDESATQNQKLERASTISHETAHMWFGDLVTMRWFTDVWMKEVFANFMAAKIVNPSFPAINHDLRFLFAYYPAAYDVDRTEGSNPIRQPLANLSEAGTLYGNIIYDKAPVVMRQLETLLGPQPFQQALRDYLRRFSFGNAAWPDLIQLLDDRTPEDLATWSQAWVDEASRPVMTSELTVENGRIARLAFRQRDPNQQRGLMWNQQFQVALGYADRVELLPAQISGSTLEVTAARGRPAPLFVLPNGGGIAYGEFHLDPASLAWLTAGLPDIGDTDTRPVAGGTQSELTRGSAWITLWDAMLDGEVTPDAIIDLALRSLPRETDEQNAQEILRQLDQAYWRFTSSARRTALAPRVEQVLRAGLAAANTSSLKGAYFSTLRDLALTPRTLAWLTSVWQGRTRVPGLTLAEADRIVLAQELALRAVPGWRSILQRQVARTLNPDRKARLAFIVPALSSDAAERARFFRSLNDVENRRHEPWVLDGLRSLHHPLRAEASEAFIQPSLEMLRDIQRTGDIFFPKRWMDATLGGHRSPAAADTVRRFVAGLPEGYPDRLRLIILSSADDLFRSARMK